MSRDVCLNDQIKALFNEHVSVSISCICENILSRFLGFFLKKLNLGLCEFTFLESEDILS